IGDVGSAGSPDAGDPCKAFADHPGSCVGALRDCNGNSADGCETDTSSNPNHCGRCGHSCLGAMCKNSLCESIPMASGQADVTVLGQGGDGLFWGSDATHSVWSISHFGESPKQVATGQGDFQLGVLVDAQYAFWSGFNGTWEVRAIAVGGGPVTSVAQTGDYPSAMAMDATTIYWADAVDGGRIVGRDKSGGAPREMASGQGSISGIAVDADHVYWSIPGASGGIKSTPTDASMSSTVMTVAAGHDAACVAVDETSIYFAD